MAVYRLSKWRPSAVLDFQNWQFLSLFIKPLPHELQARDLYDGTVLLSVRLFVCLFHETRAQKRGILKN